ncbi:MAG: oligosaccharide flippase family protein, partial [Planctomycetes bacterium]|nr:oligosaccharide flippase family protein [Planctomycetota bacterium]
MSQSSLARDLHRLTSKATVYALGMLMLRGLNFFLLPLYTRILSSEDYGIIAVTTTITMLLTIVLPLGMHNALAKSYHASKTADERAEAIWTHWLSM